MLKIRIWGRRGTQVAKEKRSAGSAGRMEALEQRTMLAATLPAGFSESTYVQGFDTPTTMEFAPDGRLFVGEKAGKIRVVKDGRLLTTPFLSLRVDTFSERGLEGIVFDPNFRNNRYMYVYYTRADNSGFNRLSRFTASASNPDVAQAGSELVILDNIPTPTGFHNGGSLHFGTDGMLYVGIGDGGSRAADAQVLSSLNGKILRLNVAAYPNIIPSNNPFVNTPGARPEIFALGFRNPFTSAVQPGTGKLFVNDVGFDTYEEVNDVRSGRNYGWPQAEGPVNDSRFTNPVYSYTQASQGGEGAVTGGVFYQANQFPSSYQGSYFFSDFTAGWIRRLDTRNGNQSSGFATGAAGPLDLDVGPDGSLYYLSAFGDGYDGTNRPVMKISYAAGGGNRAPTASSSANKTSGAGPLTVNFTGGGSDPDNDTLSYSWNFGDGSAVQSGRNVTHTFNANGRYNVVLTVSDGKGGRDTADPIRITVGSSAPTATITLPKLNLYRAGSRIYYAATASDPEDGKLRRGAFRWSVVFHHDNHTHPFIAAIPKVTSGSFKIPITGETDPDQFYRIHLTVTDSDGLTYTTFRDIHPRTSTITVNTNIPGLKINLDGQPRTGPISVVSVEGMRRTLAAPLLQTYKGVTYEFVSWSDNKRAEHQIRTSKGDLTYTAVYRRVER